MYKSRPSSVSMPSNVVGEVGNLIGSVTFIDIAAVSDAKDRYHARRVINTVAGSSIL